MPAWRRAVRETLLTAAAVTGVICVVAAIAAVMFDVRPLIFRTGSMAPEMPTGALALARTVPAEEIAVGDVVSVRRADGVRITHRVVGLQPAGSAVELTLQGDGNTEPDAVPYPAREADRVFWAQPGLGRVVHHLESTPVVFACGTIVGAVLATAVRRRRPRTGAQSPGAVVSEPPEPARGDPPYEHLSAAGDQPSTPRRSSASPVAGTGKAVSAGVLALALATTAMASSPANTAAVLNDSGAAATRMATTVVQPVVNLRCQQTGTIVTTATVHWNAPAAGPVPTGYRVRVRSNITGNIVREQVLGPAARSYQIPASLLQIGTYRVSVRSLHGSWVAPTPSTPPFVLVTVVTSLASSCG